MLAVRFICGLQKPSVTNFRQTFLSSRKSINQFKWSSSLTQKVKTGLNQDVILYKNEKPKFFLFMNVCSTLCCVSWTLVALMLKGGAGIPEIDPEKSWFWNTVVPFQRKYATIMKWVVIGFGFLVMSSTFFYTSRSVRKLMLHKGGRFTTIITYKLPFVNNVYKLPLSGVSSAQTRAKASVFIPLKVKDKPFYFLIDKTGEFLEPALFDATVGIRRNV